MNLLLPPPPSLLLLLLLWASASGARSQCDQSPESVRLNLSVTYDALPTFTADSPIQNMVTLDGIVYVGAVNRIYALAPNLTVLSEYRTGPLLANQTCGRAPGGNATSPGGLVDNHNLALVVENIYDKGLYSCGSADRGVCRRHVLDDGASAMTVDEYVYCFAERVSEGRGQPPDSDVVVGGAGSQVLNVESNVIKFFVGNSEVPGDGRRAGEGAEPHTISMRKMKTSQNGFTFFSGRSYMDLAAGLRGRYYLRYVHSFHSGPFAYFLTVQQVDKDSDSYHTRIVRMCSSDQDIRRYVEMPLECIGTDKRRRRRRSSSEDVKVFNILQAAHVAKVSGDAELQRQLKVEEDDDVLFAAFARGRPGSPEPMAGSAVCAMSLKHINNMFKMYMQRCHTVEPYHFTGSSNRSCYNVVRATVSQLLPRGLFGVAFFFWREIQKLRSLRGFDVMEGSDFGGIVQFSSKMPRRRWSDSTSSPIISKETPEEPLIAACDGRFRKIILTCNFFVCLFFVPANKTDVSLPSSLCSASRVLNI